MIQNLYYVPVNMSCECELGECGSEQFNATCLYLEDVCGSWTTSEDRFVSDFGEIRYPLSTVEYEYTGCQCDHCRNGDNSNTYSVNMSCDCELGQCGCDQFSATFLFIENVCGSWITLEDCYVSQFGEIRYPLSTVEYEYTSCQDRNIVCNDDVHL